VKKEQRKAKKKSMISAKRKSMILKKKGILLKKRVRRSYREMNMLTTLE